MNVTKMATQDAEKWARAEMFFGEGAGTRRKLLSNEIMQKGATIPGYSDKFDKAYESQDMADHAIAAAKERKKIDRGHSVRRNARGLATGNRHSMTTNVAIATSIWYALHQTGYDENVKQFAKKQYLYGKSWVETKYQAHKAKKESSRGNHGL